MHSLYQSTPIVSVWLRDTFQEVRGSARTWPRRSIRQARQVWRCGIRSLSATLQQLALGFCLERNHPCWDQAPSKGCAYTRLRNVGEAVRQAALCWSTFIFIFMRNQIWMKLRLAGCVIGPYDQSSDRSAWHYASTHTICSHYFCGDCNQDGAAFQGLCVAICRLGRDFRILELFLLVVGEKMELIS